MKSINQLIADLREIEKEVEFNNTQNANLKKAKATFETKKEEAKEIRKEVEDSKAELEKIKAEKETAIRKTEDEIRHTKANIKNMIDVSIKERQGIVDEIEKLKADNQFYFDATKDKELEINKKLDALNTREVSFNDREKAIAEKEIKIIQLEGNSLKKNNRLLAANTDIDILKDKLEADIKKTQAKQAELGSIIGAYKEMKSKQGVLMAESKEGIAIAIDLKQQASAVMAEYNAKKESFIETVKEKTQELTDQARANHLKSVELEAWDSKLKDDSARVLVETRKLNKIKEQLSK